MPVPAPGVTVDQQLPVRPVRLLELELPGQNVVALLHAEHAAVVTLVLPLHERAVELEGR